MSANKKSLEANSPSRLAKESTPPSSNPNISRPRVHLSIVKSACFEHLEGEQLFTAVSAGLGRFECDRLLKPSGIELMNLPRAANIEICVFRRRHGTTDGERQKQLLYHSILSLTVVRSFAWLASKDGSEGTAHKADGEHHLVWENWIGLFNADVNLHSKGPEEMFQQSLDMGSSSALFPRLWLRLQYLPPGTVAQPPRSATTWGIDPEGVVGPSQKPDLEASAPLPCWEDFKVRSKTTAGPVPRRVEGQLSSSDDEFKVVKRAVSYQPQASSSAPLRHTARTQVKTSDSDVIQDLQARLRQFEDAYSELQLQATQQASRESSFVEQVLPHLSKLNIPSLHQREDALDSSVADFQQVSVTIVEALKKLESNLTSAQKAKHKASSLLSPFYKPLKTDPIDCLLAATILRLDFPYASELSRIAQGYYSLGSLCPRFRCFLDNGRVVVQRAIREDSQPIQFETTSLELSTFLVALTLGPHISGSDS